MSQENVEVVRSAVEAWESEDLAAAVAFLDQQIEWISPPDDPDRVVVKGAAAATQALINWLSIWDTYRYELTELRDVDDHVIQGGRQIMDTRGVEVASDVFFVWTLRDGRAIRMQMFYRRAEALEAVGLAE